VGSNRGNATRCSSGWRPSRAPHAEIVPWRSRSGAGPWRGSRYSRGLSRRPGSRVSYMWMAVLADLHRRCGNDEPRPALIGMRRWAPRRRRAVRGVLKRRLADQPGVTRGGAGPLARAKRAGGGKARRRYLRLASPRARKDLLITSTIGRGRE